MGKDINRTKVIGLTGVATCGKDTFCKYLIENLQRNGFTAKRFALADDLKAMARMPLLELSEIDILNCDAEQKEIVRDYLVAIGKIKRKLTHGKFWTSLLEPKIIQAKVDYAVITDLRYDYYSEDEAYWAKVKMGGSLVHITRFNDGKKILPPNLDEEENDPKMETKSDYKVAWETVSDEKIFRDEASKFASSSVFKNL